MQCGKDLQDRNEVPCAIIKKKNTFIYIFPVNACPQIFSIPAIAGLQASLKISLNCLT
jgi:hypothetical protein